MPKIFNYFLKNYEKIPSFVGKCHFRIYAMVLERVLAEILTFYNLKVML